MTQIVFLFVGQETNLKMQQKPKKNILNVTYAVATYLDDTKIG